MCRSRCSFHRASTIEHSFSVEFSNVHRAHARLYHRTHRHTHSTISYKIWIDVKMLPVIFPFPSPLAFALNKSRLKRSSCPFLPYSVIFLDYYFRIVSWRTGHVCVHAFIWHCLQFGSLYRIQYISIICICGIYASIYVMALHNKYTFGIVRSSIHIIHLTSCFPNLSHPFPAWLCGRCLCWGRGFAHHGQNKCRKNTLTSANVYSGYAKNIQRGMSLEAAPRARTQPILKCDATN